VNYIGCPFLRGLITSWRCWFSSASMVWHRRISPANSVVWMTQRVVSGCAWQRQRNSYYHDSVAKPSVVALSRSWLQKYGTDYHQVWHHRQVWKFSSLAWKKSCLRDATELTNIDLLCTFITRSLTVCYVPLKFLDYTSRESRSFLLFYYYSKEFRHHAIHSFLTLIKLDSPSNSWFVCISNLLQA